MARKPPTSSKQRPTPQSSPQLQNRSDRSETRPFPCNYVRHPPSFTGTGLGQNATRWIRDSGIVECIKAAKAALVTVDSMAGDGALPAIWWTQYVVFCALAIVYVWEARHNSPEMRDGAPSRDDIELGRLSSLAER